MPPAFVDLGRPEAPNSCDELLPGSRGCATWVGELVVATEQRSVGRRATPPSGPPGTAGCQPSAVRRGGEEVGSRRWRRGSRRSPPAPHPPPRGDARRRGSRRRCRPGRRGPPRRRGAPRRCGAGAAPDSRSRARQWPASAGTARRRRGSAGWPGRTRAPGWRGGTSAARRASAARSSTGRRRTSRSRRGPRAGCRRSTSRTRVVMSARSTWTPEAPELPRLVAAHRAGQDPDDALALADDPLEEAAPARAGRRRRCGWRRRTGRGRSGPARPPAGSTSRVVRRSSRACSTLRRMLPGAPLSATRNRRIEASSAVRVAARRTRPGRRSPPAAAPR